MPTPLPQLTVPLVSFSAEDPGGWGHLFARARAADTAGVDRLTCSDHVVYGENLEAYGKAENGGSEGGVQPTGPDGHWLDPFTTLSVVAGMTSRVRLRTQILLAALRRPVVLAKCAATLDVLSGGRLDLGVGVGWQREEYEAAGLQFEGRGRLLDHTLEVCQTLWRERRASYSSPELTFKNIHQMPKPLQSGGVPFWISGTIRGSTVRRLTHFGLRWIPWGADAANLMESVPRLKEALAKAGGDADALQVVGRIRLPRTPFDMDGVRRTMDHVPEQVKLGITDFVLEGSIPKEESAAQDLLSEVVAVFREVAGREPVG